MEKPSIHGYFQLPVIPGIEIYSIDCLHGHKRACWGHFFSNVAFMDIIYLDVSNTGIKRVCTCADSDGSIVYHIYNFSVT